MFLILSGLWLGDYKRPPVRYPKFLPPVSSEKLRRLIEHAPDHLKHIRRRVRPWHLRWGALVVAVYLLADTVSLMLPPLVPDAPVVPAPPPRFLAKPRTLADYAPITGRNIFSSKGLLPEEGGDSLARKTRLPLRLVGTVVMTVKPQQSIAAIEHTAQSRIFPVQVGDWIEELAQITRIEETRVYFVNNERQETEFVELPEKQPRGLEEPTFASSRLSGVAKSGGGVTQVDETHFEVQKNVVDQGMSNLTSLLQEARAVPNFENGMPSGYKILQIQSGGLFDKLGIKNGDVITSFNGNPINDPGAAMRALGEIKTADRAQVTVKRGGRSMSLDYVLK